MHPDSGPSAVIELKQVEKIYGGVGGAQGVPALRGVDLSIPAGELVAIVGPSGSGKSTLLNLMGALDRPSSGRVIIHGSDLAGLDDDALTLLRRDRIGFVFQFFNLIPTLTALENVMLPALLAGGRPSGEIRDRASSALAQVGLAARAAHTPRTLSGGEMQRVAIARALVLDPPLVLADEPTGNLDSRTGKDVLAFLIGARTEKRTVVLVTHDPRVAERADRVLTMRDGRLVGDGPHYVPEADEEDENAEASAAS